MQKVELPPLPYAYDALEPVISKETMTLHHDKHHAAYVNATNAALEKLDKSRKGEMEIDTRAVLRDLTFNLNGHILHSMFWTNMKGTKDNNKPNGEIAKQIDKDFGSFDAFKKEFDTAAKTVEGSGWAVLGFEQNSKQLVIVQIEKHNINNIANLRTLLILDVWEHAFYVDYKNDKAAFVDKWWDIVNWDEVEKRFTL
ncbi:superoxide dismutase [archaeon]|nr:MAG: superoxide dismutase [archaeon]